MENHLWLLQNRCGEMGVKLLKAHRKCVNPNENNENYFYWSESLLLFSFMEDIVTFNLM